MGREKAGEGVGNRKGKRRGEMKRHGEGREKDGKEGKGGHPSRFGLHPHIRNPEKYPGQVQEQVISGAQPEVIYARKSLPVAPPK